MEKIKLNTLEKKVCVIVNPYAASGQTIRRLDEITATLHNLDVDHHVCVTKDTAEAQQVASRAALKEEYVFVVGGDGTLRVVAEALQFTNTALSVIPCGRGNDFARVLNIPIDPIAACKILVREGKEQCIDMARVNERNYLSICSLGFDSVANTIANRTSFIPGRAIYAYAGLMALIRWKSTHFRLTVDGQSLDHFGYTVAVANSKCYGGGMLLAPNASMTDAWLDIVLIEDIHKLRMLFNFPRVFRGTHVSEPGFKTMRAKHVTIEANEKYTVFADGDAVGSPPAEIKIIPQSLRVLAPANVLL